MGRLTERHGNTYVPNENANYEPMNCMDKLGRLEDLEEQGRLIVETGMKVEYDECTIDGQDGYAWLCPKCFKFHGETFKRESCSRCGQKVIWEDEECQTE